ncbi:choice-of-anchor D domain-containing protein [Dactylosporangium darangshiense]|uniref:choice-of-anchor D domain-containing protein n=1 Tax=Dactylosporangium darangshiense TaxID=579108 RepID=UPI0036366F41
MCKFGAIVGATALAVTALPGVANAAAPTAPYDAFTINGSVWNYSFDPGNATIALGGRGPEGFDFSATTPGSGHWFHALVAAPQGKTLGLGTFPTTRMGDATHYALDVFGDGVGCSDSSGSVTIHALTRDAATNAITSIAASYYQDCYDTNGEIRWHSDQSYVNGIRTPSFLGFGTVDVGHSSPVQTVTITSSGSSALKLGTASLGGAVPDAYTITGDTCTNATLQYGQSCTIGVRGQPTAGGDQDATLTVPDNTTFGKRTIGLGMSGRLDAEGTYVPVIPSRLLDTREGNGAPKAPLGGGQTMYLQVTGRGGVPSSKVSAVVLNMTVTGPTSAGYLTVYPTGITRPTASNLNFPAGWTGANAVTVPVGTDGQVDIFNAAGNVHVIADVLGYYYAYDDTHTQWAGGQYQPTLPERVLDTRDSAFGGALAPSEYVRIPVSYGSAVDSHIRALAVNITAVTPTMGGFVTAWNGIGPPPTASTLNFTPGSVVPNFAVVPTAWCFQCGGGGYPSIGVGNYSGGYTHIVVDIFGFYDDGQLPGGLRFHPLTPTRIVDTRDGLGASTFTGTGTKTVTAPTAVAGDNTYALVTNVTGVDPANSTYLSLWATGDTKPTVSNLNLTPHEVRPNAAFVPVGPGNKFNVFNAAWKVDVVIDVSGTFEFAPGSALPGQVSSLDRQGPLHSGSTGTPQRQTLP